MPTHRFDEIRSYPTVLNKVSQTVYRSHQILQEVKRMLAEFYSADAILDIIALLETDLPSQGISVMSSITKEEYEAARSRYLSNTPDYTREIREDE